MIFGQPLWETLPVFAAARRLAAVALAALLALLARRAAVGLLVLGERGRRGEQERRSVASSDGEAHRREPNRWRAS